jgi:hypothetical protein
VLARDTGKTTSMAPHTSSRSLKCHPGRPRTLPGIPCRGVQGAAANVVEGTITHAMDGFALEALGAAHSIDSFLPETVCRARHANLRRHTMRRTREWFWRTRLLSSWSRKGLPRRCHRCGNDGTHDLSDATTSKPMAGESSKPAVSLQIPSSDYPMLWSKR